jgi:ATP-dependent Clp protease ATP-binding subunit ClpA
VRHLLTQSNANVNQLRSDLSAAMECLPSVEGAAGDLHISNDLGGLMNRTDELAQKRNDQYISSEPFLLVAVEERSELDEMLRKAGADRQTLEQSINKMHSGQKMGDPNAKDQCEALEKYTMKLTKRAEQGKLDPAIGHDDKIRLLNRLCWKSVRQDGDDEARGQGGRRNATQVGLWQAWASWPAILPSQIMALCYLGCTLNITHVC